MRNKKYFAVPYAVWVAGFIVIPLITIVYYAFTSKQGNFTFDNIAAIIQPIHLKPLLTSFELALISTVICLIIAYPLALILSSKGAKKGFLVFLFILPMWMNYLLRILALQSILSDNGVLNTFLSALHLPTVSVMNSPTAIVIGMVYDYLPFMILPIFNSLSRIDRGLIEAANDLGAGWGTTLRRVIFPLSLPGIISGITMVFIPAISEFVIANIMGGGKVSLIGSIIEQEFTYFNNKPLGSGLSLVLMVFIMITIALTSKFDKSGGENSIW